LARAWRELARKIDATDGSEQAFDRVKREVFGSGPSVQGDIYQEAGHLFNREPYQLTARCSSAEMRGRRVLAALFIACMYEEGSLP
jgi:hypothetical protein